MGHVQFLRKLETYKYHIQNHHYLTILCLSLDKTQWSLKIQTVLIKVLPPLISQKKPPNEKQNQFVRARNYVFYEDYLSEYLLNNICLPDYKYPAYSQNLSIQFLSYSSNQYTAQDKIITSSINQKTLALFWDYTTKVSC